PHPIRRLPPFPTRRSSDLRLCVETGGIYFAVHPNRKVGQNVNRREIAAYSSYLAKFYDPEVMRKYKPEYVSIPEYEKRVRENKADRKSTRLNSSHQINSYA